MFGKNDPSFTDILSNKVRNKIGTNLKIILTL